MKLLKKQTTLFFFMIKIQKQIIENHKILAYSVCHDLIYINFIVNVHKNQKQNKEKCIKNEVISHHFTRFKIERVKKKVEKYKKIRFDFIFITSSLSLTVFPSITLI